MYKKIKDFFTINLYWKALSVLMAVVLWFIVMNINNPTEIKTFTLNVSLVNEEKLLENNIIVLNMQELQNQKAEIKIKGSRTTLDELNKKINKENIKLIIDLEQFSTYKIGEEPLETTVNLKPDMPNISYPNNNFEIVSFSPVTANVYLDKVVTVDKPIKTKVLGKVKDGYIASNPELETQSIAITGAKSIVDSIEGVYAEVDLNNQTSNIDTEVEPVAYDKDGKKVEGIIYSTDKINVKVPITLQGTIRILSPNLVGAMPNGYMVSNVYYEPKTIEVVGSSKNIKDLTSITLPDIDISKLEKSITYTYDISPILEENNLVLKNGSSNIQISIDIIKSEEKTFHIPTKNITINGYNEEFLVDMPDSFSVNLIGKPEDFKNIDENMLKASINISNLSEGIHSVKVDMVLQSNLKISKDVYIDVVIKKNIENETTQEQESEDTSTETTTEIVQEMSEKESQTTTVLEQDTTR